MIDIVNPDEEYSVGQFKKEAIEIIENLWKT
jgi:tRNA A37 N6-isopentenylltransferase MiaA